ncbi:MAG: type I-U CRISPR-associated RAMP protein Csb1/Cas7u [Rhodovarius sp.]|nr:type I-U CRISPR-associated RAMP protein Csb1/Cas7u [Rhodovarius sp.]
MTEPMPITHQMLEAWADDPAGPVALHLRQKLLPAEGEGAVIFPPTYADIGYNIDTLSDGTKVATIDSVGSQANRIEPLFKHPPLDRLVPQISIRFGNEKTVSLLDIGHRLADAAVRHSALAKEVEAAFQAYLRDGNAEPIARLAPTSLVFGVWDSRGGGAKVPRLLNAVIRAWNVEVLTRSAVYVPPVDYAALEVFSEEDRAKAEGNTKSPLAQKGFVHVPAGRMHGGILARDGIVRDVTINLIALRRLNEQLPSGPMLRRYVLGLALAAATAPLDGFLRQGCLLVPDPAAPACWVRVDRDGLRTPIALESSLVLDFATEAARRFGVAAPRSVDFDPQSARQEVRDQQAGGGKRGRGRREAEDAA